MNLWRNCTIAGEAAQPSTPDVYAPRPSTESCEFAKYLAQQASFLMQLLSQGMLHTEHSGVVQRASLACSYSSLHWRSHLGPVTSP